MFEVVLPYIKAGVCFVAFFLVAKLTRFLLATIANWFVRKTKTKIDDIILSTVKTPIFYLIILAGVAISFNFLPFPSSVKQTISRIVSSIIIIISCYMAASIINILIKGWFTKRRKVTGEAKKNELVVIARKILNLIVFTLVVIFILTLWGVNVTSLVASLGIAGFVLGFALKDTFANVFGGIALIADKSFKIGDFIKLETGEVGEIIDIGLRSTRIKSFDENNEIIIPNSSLVMSKITNYGRPLVSLRMVIKIGVAYGSDIKKVKKVLLDCVHQVKGVLENPEPKVYFMEMADFSLNFHLIFWIKNYRDRIKITDEVTSLAYEQLQKEGIKIPFPTQTLYIEK